MVSRKNNFDVLSAKAIYNRLIIGHLPY